MAVFDFGFTPTPRRRFLEVAAGVGAPSLAAFYRGFHVTATDISEASVAEDRMRALLGSTERGTTMCGKYTFTL